MTDAVNHPSHYADHYSHEVIELVRMLRFDEGNIIKYLLRSPWKADEVEDLKKAAWYVQDVLDHYPLPPRQYVGEARRLCEAFEADLKARGDGQMALVICLIRKGIYRPALAHLNRRIAIIEARKNRKKGEAVEMDEEFL